MSMQQIETLAEQFAQRRHTLADLLNQIDAEQRAIITRNLRQLRLALADAAAAEDELRNAIDAAPELFDKPRTRVLHGVKVGYQKGKGKVEIPDETKTIRYIREKLPPDQAELMIRVTEKVERRAVMDLTASDLKRLGIRIVESGDQIVIKPVDSQVDKLIKALLADLPDEQEAAA
jgi:predicted RND superfamily exporter protein